MFEGDGAFPRQPVHGGKDLGPGITGQLGSEFIQRAGAGPSELLVDCRFDQKFLCHIVPPQRQETSDEIIAPVTRNGVAQSTVNDGIRQGPL